MVWIMREKLEKSALIVKVSVCSADAKYARQITPVSNQEAKESTELSGSECLHARSRSVTFARRVAGTFRPARDKTHIHFEHRNRVGSARSMYWMMVRIIRRRADAPGRENRRTRRVFPRNGRSSSREIRDGSARAACGHVRSARRKRSRRGSCVETASRQQRVAWRIDRISERKRTRTHCCSVQTLPDTTRTTLTVGCPPSAGSTTTCRPRHVRPRGGLEPRLTRGLRAGRGTKSPEEGWPFSIVAVVRVAMCRTSG